ncbi:MAG: competence/damage-inducible protein A [Nitrospirota bacterium]
MRSEQNGIRTAGIIIIGNEILSGKIHDSNAFYLASELHSLGVSVSRISVIPDEIDIIGGEALEFSERYDYVFTSGGVGPTHDDVTMAGIARGFGVKLLRHPDLENFFRLRYGGPLNAAIMKMTELPEGSNVITQENMRFPVISFRNIFIFPGIPEYLREKFSLIKERFRTSAFRLRRFFLNADEPDIANILNKVVAENTDVIFGSYPVLGNPEYRIIVTAESKSEGSLDKALNDFQKRLPEEIIVRID